MITVRQYRPAYFSGFEKEEHEVAVPSAIREIEFIKNFQEMPDFHRFSVAENGPTQCLLVAEYEEGFKWYVVAVMPSADFSLLLTEFPKFEAKYKEGSKDG